MEFTIVEKNSFIYESDEHLYIKVRAPENLIYLRCTLSRNSGCKGFAKIEHAINTLITTHEHDHDELSIKSVSHN